MARIRTIKPEFFRDSTILELSYPARLLFIGLWCEADRAGRLLDHPKDLKLSLFPDQEFDVDEAIGAMSDLGLVIRYEANGERYLQVVNFAKHQRISGKEAGWQSNIPGPPEANGEAHDASREAPVKQAPLPGCFTGSTCEASSVQERKGKERKGSTTLASRLSETLNAQPPTPTSPSVLTFPTNGSGPPTWDLTEAQVSTWKGLYAIDVEAECRKALAWVNANGKKTARGMPKFLVGWLNRTNDSGAKRPASAGVGVTPLRGWGFGTDKGGAS